MTLHASVLAPLRDILDMLPFGVAIYDPQGRPTLWNRHYSELCSSRGRFEDCAHREVASDRHIVQAPVPSGAPDYGHSDLQIGDNWLRIRRCRLGDGHTVGIWEDITEAKRRDESFQVLFDNNPLPMWVYDRENLRFLAVNDAAIKTYGYSRPQFLSMTILDIRPEEEREELRDIIAAGGYEFEDRTWHHSKANGAIISVSTYVQALNHESRSAALIAAIDVTERKRAEARVKHMAQHDAMTGLANRVLFRHSLNDALEAVRYGSRLAVFYVDLDRFKQVNDVLGHAVGDDLLRGAAERLRACARDGDIVARLGGDEFAIVQIGLSATNTPEMLAERIIELFTKPFKIRGNEICIAASIGIALAPDHAADADNLLKMADLALYRAKSNGRNGYWLFDREIMKAVSDRRDLESELRQAIWRNEFELHFQPIIDSRTRRICCAEALVWWRHPTRGLLAPAHFIELAEQTGLITEIGEWVLHAACVEAAKWPGDIRLAVNLSPIQVKKPNLADLVLYTLAESGLAPERLELEITETMLIESADECLPTLNLLKNLGITLALDDFGTGYSSFTLLTMFPFDKIKIDKSFTQNLTKRADCAAVVSAAIALAKSLDMATTAEGVETADQCRWLRSAGATSLQGYYFQRPVTGGEIDFLRVYEDGGAVHAA